MIFGNEGLPGSGKSLDAMQHIVDSMQAGRVVITNIHGLSHAAIAEYCAIPLPTIQRLLITLIPPAELDEEKKVVWVKDQFLQRQINDSLWIWDEINQFWPPERQPLPADWAKFITEHRHLGIDVLIMGQDLAELHTTWRKRLQRYTRFTKLDMMGKDDQFHWRSLTNIGKNKFRATAEGKKPYNKAFFPLYKSHRDETQNKANYQDRRFGVFQTKHKVWAGIFGIFLIASIWNVAGFFTPPKADPKSDDQPAAEQPQAKPAEQGAHQPTAVASKSTEQHHTDHQADAKADAKPEPIDYLDKYATDFQLRLTGIIDRQNPAPGQAAFEFVLEFVDPAYRVKERMSRRDVFSLGWAIERHPYGIKITKDGVSHIARPWPLDNFGKVPQGTVDSLKPVSVGPPLLAAPAVAAGPSSSAPVYLPAHGANSGVSARH